MGYTWMLVTSGLSQGATLEKVMEGILTNFADGIKLGVPVNVFESGAAIRGTNVDWMNMLTDYEIQQRQIQDVPPGKTSPVQ